MIRRPDWNLLQELFEGALRLPPSERSAYLHAHAPDEALRAEVESLLAANAKAAGFLSEPALGDERSSGEAGASRLPSGSRLGAFEVLHALGSGGMGEVYRARDTRLDRFVAIKVLSRELDLATHGRERFAREARAISKLSHPHICAVHDVGTAQVDGSETPFLVLELLEGETLAARLDGGALPIQQALTAAIEIADALAAAHAQGVVHRDLKPSNVMITGSGVKLLDFGLAQLRLRDRANEEPRPVTAESLTQAGALIGTLPYMAPEQLMGHKADARSDIFSFGAVLYEMLTGERAFAGDSGRPTAALILTGDPRPVHELAPTVPADVAKIVSHCLHKDPTRRYQNIGDVKVALEHVRDASRAAVLRPGVRMGTRGRLAVAALIVSGVAIAAYVALRPRATPNSLAPPRVVPVSALPGTELTPTLSPDGQSVAFSWTGINQDNDDIYVQRIGSGSALRRTVDPARDFSPAWSPDGQWIAFLRGAVPGRNEVMLVSPLGGPERSIGEIQIRQVYAIPPFLAWFPDSRAMVVVHSPPDKPTGLFVISIETREMQPLTSPPASVEDMAPAVSPDGHSLAFKRGPDLMVVGVSEGLRSTTPPRRLVSVVGLGPAAWTPDGTEIIFADDHELWRVDVSGKSAPAPVPFVGQGTSMPALSQSAVDRSVRLVYVRAEVDSNIWRLELAGPGGPPSSPPALFDPSTMLDGNPQFSPDGLRVAFQSARSGVPEIWIAKADGDGLTQLTSMGAGARGSPRWSPDGESIAFDANLDGQWDIYIVPSKGGKPKRMTYEPVEDSIPSFSTDGTFLYFTSKRSGTFEIWKMPVAGRDADAVRVTHDGGVVAFESTDGHLYYTNTHSGPSPLWRMPASGPGQPERVLDGVHSRSFQVLKDGIYYIELLGDNPLSGLGPAGGVGLLRTGQRARIRFFNFADGKSNRVTDIDGAISHGLAVSPDGRTVLFGRRDAVSSDLMMVENFR